MQRIVLAAVLLVGRMGLSTAVASAEEGNYALKPAATMKGLPTSAIGKRVAVRLESAEELEGPLTG